MGRPILEEVLPIAPVVIFTQAHEQSRVQREQPRRWERKGGVQQKSNSGQPQSVSWSPYSSLVIHTSDGVEPGRDRDGE